MHSSSVLVGIGVEVTFEVIAAAALLRKTCPDLRVRVVNVTDLMILGPYASHPHALQDSDFDALFTPDRPVIVNYHGYPIELRGLLFGRPNLGRFKIEGYREEGRTTSPFDMMLSNHSDRYHIAAEAVRGGALNNPKVQILAQLRAAEYLHAARKDKDFILENGKGMFVIQLTPSVVH